jgi:hypothetical protein
MDSSSKVEACSQSQGEQFYAFILRMPGGSVPAMNVAQIFRRQRRQMLEDYGLIDIIFRICSYEHILPCLP